MSAYSAFLDYVMPDVPGCTTQLAEHEIRNACIEFCENSLILQRDHDPVTIVAGIVDYDLEPPTGTLVTRVMKAWYKGTELVQSAPDNINKSEVYNRLFTGADVSRSDVYGVPDPAGDREKFADPAYRIEADALLYDCRRCDL
jgi:hypothetical protein